MLNKKSLTERDICTKFITPALAAAGWDIQKQVREEWLFTYGRIIVRGNKYARGQRKRADYVLFYKSTMIAVVEAKDNNHSVGHGMQQAKEYAEILDFLESKKSGMADSQVNITQDNIKLTPIALPPLAEQEAIVAKVDQLMQLCDELEQQIQQSKQETEALMQAVVQEALQVHEEEVIN